MTERLSNDDARKLFQPKKRASKYGAKRTELDGVKFDSKGESERYAALQIEAKAGLIENLTLQPRYPLVVNGETVCTYVADFSYLRDGKQVVEDWKGFRTPAYRLKAKLFAAVHGYPIFETGTKGEAIPHEGRVA